MSDGSQAFDSNWSRSDFLKSVAAMSFAPVVAAPGLEVAESLHPHSAEELLETVPRPVLPGRPDLVEMYDKCWKLGMQSSEHGTAENGFVDWYIDASFDNRIFQWDTCFAMAWAKYSQGGLPNIESLDNFYRKQHSDGAISGVIQKKDGKDDQPKSAPWFTRNPLFSWAEWEYYQVTGDSSRFKRVVPILRDYIHWIRTHRRHDNGHFYWSGWSSGMDNSPRSRADKFYPPYDWIDYDANMALAMFFLAKMARVAGYDAIGRTQWRHYRQLKGLINRDMWSEKDHFYWDRDRDGSFMKVKTVASFWPMWARVTEKKHVNGLAAHLNDTDSFNRPHRTPTLAAEHDAYVPSGGYWRGAVWPPTNHMTTKGLQANGRYKLARDMVGNHLNNIAAVFAGTDTVWENYAPEFTKPGEPAQPDFVGWSADGPIAQLIEHYIGINLYVPANKIRWNLLTTEQVGLKNLKFGGDRIKLVAQKRKRLSDPVIIETETSRSFELELCDGKNVFKKTVRPTDKTVEI